MTSRLLTLLSTSDARAHYAAGHWRGETIYGLVAAHASTSPDKVAVRERTRSITYRGLVEAADGLAGSLRDQGLRPGRRVAVWLPSRIETAVAVLACSRGGYVCCPSLHRNHTVAEVVELLERMGAAAFLGEVGYGADGDRVDAFALAGRVDGMRHVDAMEPADRAPLPAPGPSASGRAGEAGPIHDDPDTVVYLAFTSGTTGAPKGVMHSDNTLLANARALADEWSLDERMVVCSLSPWSHNLGFGAMVMTLTGGGELVVPDLPRGASVVQRLAETRTTFAFGVPTHAIDLLTELESRAADGLSALRGFRLSGAPVPSVVARGLLEHGIVPQSGYGMTEAGSHHYTLPDDDPRLIVETSGRACPGYEVEIFSQQEPDRPLPPGEVGQIGGRGASLMLGYFDDQAGTEAAFNDDGWFLTGDLGWMDEAGYLRVTGRKKDLIVRGGHNIFPARIEELAMRHPAVARAAAVPVADERLGERVCLAVVLEPGRRVAPDVLLDHLDAEGLSRYDMPEYLVEADELPLTASGKTLKRELTSWIEQGRLSPTPVRFGGSRGDG